MTIEETLRGIDFQSLPISDYSRNHIMRIMSQLDYYMRIYRRVLRRLQRLTKLPLSKMTLVDYGGGHGFFSLLAKQMGAARVIYVDINPKAVETVKAVAEVIGWGPDTVLCGDSTVLTDWCFENQVVPDALAGIDVIEHIYDLDEFFLDLYCINSVMPAVFTTGSNPYNHFVKKRLREIMMNDEEVFFRQRAEIIKEAYPNWDMRTARFWGMLTRGLKKEDVLECVRNRQFGPKLDAYNTCDPYTGSWTERILPIREYRQLVSLGEGHLRVRNGFYDSSQGGRKGFMARLANVGMHFPFGVFFAPFIFLECRQVDVDAEK